MGVVLVLAGAPARADHPESTAGVPWGTLVRNTSVSIVEQTYTVPAGQHLILRGVVCGKETDAWSAQAGLKIGGQYVWLTNGYGIVNGNLDLHFTESQVITLVAGPYTWGSFYGYTYDPVETCSCSESPAPSSTPAPSSEPSTAPSSEPSTAPTASPSEGPGRVAGLDHTQAEGLLFALDGVLNVLLVVSGSFLGLRIVRGVL